MKKDNQTLCRVCLQCDLHKDHVSSIFDINDKGFIYEKLNYIADVHIKPGDGLPDKICAECLVELENAVNFKHKCETSNSILVSAASAEDALKGEESLEEEVKEEPVEYAETEYFEEVPASPTELTEKRPSNLPELPLEHTETEDLEELPASPSELSFEMEESEEPEQPNAEERPLIPELPLEPYIKPSRAIDLKLECHDCGNLFKSKCKLKVHWFKVHKKEQLTCKICQKTFGSFKKLEEHIINKTKKCMTLSQVNVTGEGKSQTLHCKECIYSTSINNVNHMSTHLDKHKGYVKQFSCTICPTKYFDNLSLKKHMESRHGAEKTEKKCTVCGELILGRIKYQTHMKNHRRITCTVCNKSIVTVRYKVHMLLHSNEKTFFCHLCGKSFKRSSNLHVHLINVHGETKFTCDLCGYSNTSKYKLNEHRRKHIDHKDFVCEICGKFFLNDQQLTVHKKKHIARNYKCSQCNESFFKSNILLKHINSVHSKDMDPKDLFSKELEMSLLKKQLDIRKYKCTQCEKAYSKKCRLVAHTKKVH